jgi:hypothetical protein
MKKRIASSAAAVLRRYLTDSSFAVIAVDWLATTLTPRDQAA